MKKIILLFVLFLGFSAATSAQELKTSQKLDKTEMIKGVNEVSSFLKVDNNLKEAFTMLVDMRLEALSNASTDAEKKKINERFNTKILAGLTKEQRTQLQGNESMYKKVIFE